MKLHQLDKFLPPTQIPGYVPAAAAAAYVINYVRA